VPEQRVEITKDEPLLAGQTVWLTFQVNSWLWVQSAEIAAIESKIESRRDFQLIGNTLPDINGYIEFECRVIDPKAMEPEVQKAGWLTGAIIIGVITTAGLVTASLLFVKIEKAYQARTEYVKAVEGSPAVSTALKGGGIAAGAIGLAILVAVAGKYINLKL
jgi:hypothetical protein